MLSGVASAASILRMYTARVQPFFSAWYLSLGLVGTAARLHRVEMRQGKARMPLSFEHAAANSLARISPTFMRRFLFTNVFHNLASGSSCVRLTE
ncbi:hypothetical protein V6N11_065119 [Hibiscus sabdariffa]|uniref:Secreted protein n=1 Tax=Hibiscus sabdariffa TaxID=183260 RepID=A0ABR2SJU7_9ROSI